MSCDLAGKLVPLYVESDLSPRRMARVRRHLEGCLACRALLEEYRASQRWLHAARTPEIGGAALEGLRRAVWQRIAALPARSALERRLDRVWAGLRRWAAQPAMAALVVFAVVAGSLTLSGVTRPAGRAEPGAAQQIGERAGHPGDGLVGDDAWLGEHAPGDGDDLPEPMLAQASFEDGAEDGEPGDRGDGDERGAASEAVPVEIQTRDPNVRILWFAPAGDHAGVED
jgi:Putative zinc-finger